MSTRDGSSDQFCEDAIARARDNERAAVAKILHDGILQDLTIVGLRLEALHRKAAEPLVRAEIDEVAVWLRSRQAVLRQLIAEWTV